jgi:hypothetical protein
MKIIRLKSLMEWKEHGSVWKTKNGKFAAKNKRGRVKYFKTEQLARDYSHTGVTRSSEQKLPDIY